MKNFHQSLICLDLKFIQVTEDAKSLYKATLGIDPTEEVQNFIFDIKFSGAKRIYLSEIGDIMFIDWGGRRKGEKNIQMSPQIEYEMMNLIKSATPKTVGVGHGLVMIEPGRFTKESLSEFFVKNCGTDGLSEDILFMKSKGISKVWVYMPSGEIVFFKRKIENQIDFSYFLEKINTVRMFGTKKSDLNPVKIGKRVVLDLVENEAKSLPVVSNKKPILDMDGILDKIGEFGMDSLLQEEIEFLKGIK